MESIVKKIISQTFGVNENDISGETTMERIDRWDSLTHIELVTKIEEAFSLRLEPEDMVRMISYNEILCLLKEKE